MQINSQIISMNSLFLVATRCGYFKSFNCQHPIHLSYILHYSDSMNPIAYAYSYDSQLIEQMIFSTYHVIELQPTTTVSSIPCGTGGSSSSSRRQRIVGGSDAVRGQTTYIASLMKYGGHFCGATVLNERWLISAGHCGCK